MPRRVTLVLLVLGLAVFASWLLVGRGGEQGAGAVVSHEEASTDSEERKTPLVPGTPSLVGTPDAEPTHAPLGTVGDVTVRVLGRGEVPLPDVPVFRIGELGEIADVELTNAQGRVTFAELPYGGEAWIAPPRLNDDHRLEPGERRRVMGPRMVLHVDLGMPCEVVPVDVATGRALAGVATTLVPRLSVPHTLRAPRVGHRLVLARPGTDVALELAVEVPPGYVLWANDEPYVKISRYAKALRYVVPLHREADVELDVLEHDGSPARDPYVSAWTLSGKEGASAGNAETERLAVNRLRIREVPYVEGGVLEVRVGVEAPADHRLASATTPLARRMRLVVRLPHPDEYTLSDAPFKGPAPGMIGLGGGGEGGPPPLPPEGRVEVAAVLRNGEPAAGATVTLRYLEEGYALRAFRAVLDENGRYEDDVPEGTWRVHFYEPGLVQTGETFEVRAGESTQARLQEGEGGTVQVRVVGPDGRPLPFARIRLNDWMWRDLADGVQRLDPYVDLNGARTLRHVSPGDFEVSAWYAGGTATAEVTVIEGETVSVTVEVAPAR